MGVMRNVVSNFYSLLVTWLIFYRLDDLARSEREAEKMATRENNRMPTDVCCFDTFVSIMKLVKYITDCILPYFFYLSRHIFITDNLLLRIFGSKSDGKWVGFYSQQQVSRRMQPESKTQRLDNIFLCSIK